MKDTERMLRLLREAGPKGVHSHDLRRLGYTGNPSQRAADLEAQGHDIERKRENVGKRPGCRYTLIRTVGSSAAGRGSASNSTTGLADATLSAASSDETLFELPPAHSAYDPWERAA